MEVVQISYRSESRVQQIRVRPITTGTSLNKTLVLFLHEYFDKQLPRKQSSTEAISDGLTLPIVRWQLSIILRCRSSSLIQRLVIDAVLLFEQRWVHGRQRSYAIWLELIRQHWLHLRCRRLKGRYVHERGRGHLVEDDRYNRGNTACQKSCRKWIRSACLKVSSH
jgi:hypothetical protein